ERDPHAVAKVGPELIGLTPSEQDEYRYGNQRTDERQKHENQREKRDAPPLWNSGEQGNAGAQRDEGQSPDAEREYERVLQLFPEVFRTAGRMIQVGQHRRKQRRRGVDQHDEADSAKHYLLTWHPTHVRGPSSVLDWRKAFA